jgi:hypothetical protein
MIEHPRCKCWQNNIFLEVLIVQDARIGLKTDFKNTKSLRLGITEGEEVMLGIVDQSRGQLTASLT